MVDREKLARLRKSCMREFVQTERSYVKDLQLVINVFLTPLREQLSSQDIGQLFGNVEIVCKLHEQLVDILAEQEVLDPENQIVGATILKYADFMKIYSSYCSNMNTSRETLRNLQKVPPFAAVLRESEKNPDLRGLTIGDFLIKPVQRIMKYPLLLKELIDNTDPAHSDRKDLVTAQAKISAILDKINSEKRESEAISSNQQQLKELQQQIDDLEINLRDNPSRKLVQKSTITRIADNEQQEFLYFLFTDLFMVCKNKGAGKYQFKCSYPFSKSLVRIAEDRDFEECFELLQMENKDTIHKYGVTLEDKNFLYKYLKEAIYAQTLHIEHIIKVKYGWFLEEQAEQWIADLVFCYRLYATPQEFLKIFETEYESIEVGKDVLWQFIDGLESTDFKQNDQLKSILENMISQVKNTVVQTKMTTALKKAQRLVNRTIANMEPSMSGMGSVLPSVSTGSNGSGSGGSSPINSPVSTRRTRAMSNAGLDQHLSPPLFGRPRGLSFGDQPLPFNSPSSFSAGTFPRLASLSAPVRRSSIAVPLDTLFIPPDESAEATPEVLRPLTIAQCITRRESKALRAIRPQEIILGEGTNLDFLLELYAWTSRWVCTKILSFETPQKRAEAITTFISAAFELRQMNNFNGLMEVLHSLHSPIERLKDSWGLVPPAAKDKLAALDELMSPTDNYKNYREALKSIKLHAPCIPYIFVFLADVDVIDLPDSVDGNINMDFVRQMSVLLRELRSYQKTHHKFRKNLPWIYMDTVLKDDEHIEKMAMMCAEGEETNTESRSNTVRKNRSNRRKSLYLSPIEGVPKGTNKDWERIMAVSETKKYQREDIIVHENGASGIFQLTQGSATMSRKGRTLSKILPGELFVGFALLNENGMAGITVVSDTPYTEVKTAKMAYVKQILEIDGELSSRFYMHFANTALRSDMSAFAVGDFAHEPVKAPNVALQYRAMLGDIFHLRADDVVIKSYNCKYKKITGKLSVSNTSLLFYGKIFGIHKQKQIPFSQVAYVKAAKHLEVKQEVANKTHKFIFQVPEQVEEAEALIRSVFQNDQNQPTATLMPRVRTKDLVDELERVMSTTDWQRILKGTSTTFCTAGSVIIEEGTQHSALYQIIYGVCTVQKKVIAADGTERIVKIAQRKTGDIFGEMSFIDPGAEASASVIATTDLEICTLDFHYITVLLSVYKHLAPKFYKYIALLLRKRLHEFEKEASK